MWQGQYIIRLKIPFFSLPFFQPMATFAEGKIIFKHRSNTQRSRQCQSQEQMHMPKIGSVIHIIIGYYNHYTHRPFLLTAQAIYAYILERLGIVSTATNESILAPLSKQTESSYSPCDLRYLGCFPRWWLGLTTFSLACPDLAADQSPKLKHL